MKTLKEKDFVESSELSLCATLLYFGYKIENINSQGKRSIFVFKKNKEIDKKIQSFWCNELLVNPKAYFICLKEIKSRLYSRN